MRRELAPLRVACGLLVMIAAASPATVGPAAPDALMQLVDHPAVVTRHEGVYGGHLVRYHAVVEAIEVPDAAGRPAARLVSFDYLVDGVTDTSKRPVIFLFNGGPIVPATYIQLGGLGPKRVRFPDDTTADVSALRLVDNPSTRQISSSSIPPRPGLAGCCPAPRPPAISQCMPMGSRSPHSSGCGSRDMAVSRRRNM